jgi:hypothetical protein
MNPFYPARLIAFYENIKKGDSIQITIDKTRHFKLKRKFS